MKKQNLALRLAAAHVAAGVALLASVTPSAASEPTSTDAWGQAIRRGAKQEGIKTDEQKEEDEAEEAKLMAERLKLRWSVHAGFGVFATSLEGDTYFDDLIGPEFAFGAGLQKGLSRLWDLQARASLSIVPASGADLRDSNSYNYYAYGRSGVTSEGTGATMMIPSVDATFRVHFGETSPWFFGMGARFGGVVAWGTLVETRRSSTDTSVSEIPQSKMAPFVQALLEIGVAVADHIELVVRPSVGAALSQHAHPAVGFIGGGAYVF